MHVGRILAFGAPLLVDAAACALVVDERVAAGAAVHGAAALLAFGVGRAVVRRAKRAVVKRADGAVLERADGAAASAAGLASALLALCLPGVGLAILGAVAWPAWSVARETRAGGVLEIALPDASAPLELEPAPRGGVRTIRQRLRDAASPEERVSAVMELRHMDARRAVPLLRQAFAHPSEDVRLLSFAILERREKRLRARIKHAEARLAAAREAAEPELVTRLRGRLARDQWELVYGGFVSGDLEPVVLNTALEHANDVLDQRPDAALSLLLARIYLRRREPARAWAFLEQADGAGAPGASTAPLFAEAAFQLRRFSSIPSILRRARRAELNRPELEPVARFWMEREQA